MAKYINKFGYHKIILKYCQGLNLSFLSRNLNIERNLFIERSFHSSSNLEHNYPNVYGPKTWGGVYRKGRAQELKTFKERVDNLKENNQWFESKRAEFIEWNYESEIFALSNRLSETFDDDLLKESLRDISYIRQEEENAKKMSLTIEMKSNQELSTAGLSLLLNFLPKYLRAACPSLPEEGIQGTVEFITSPEELAKIARGVGLTDLILTREHPPSDEICAKSFCAMVGALNTSCGIERTYKFIQDFVIAQLVNKDLWDVWSISDPLSLLTTILNSNGKKDIEPRVIGDIGKNTIEAVYCIGIYADKEYISKGYGNTPKDGIKAAAYNSLSKIFDQALNKNPLSFTENPGNHLKEEPNPSFSQLKISL